MKTSSLKFAAFICLANVPVMSFANNLRCEDIGKLAQMASAKTEQSLEAARSSVQDGYLREVIYFARRIELKRADDETSMEMLSLIPNSEDQWQAVLGLGDMLCDDETLAEMQILGKLRDELPSAYSVAVIAVPEKMTDYLKYAITASEDPHNNILIYMQRVCKERGRQLRRAISLLPREKQSWFSKRIFDSCKCKIIALPEGG